MNPADAPIRVLIADDHSVVREGLRTILERAGIEVVGEAASGREAVEKTETLRPDVVLLDIRMPDEDGLHALTRIKERAPETRVIILTTYTNPGYLAQAIIAGATGYLTKETSPNQIVGAIRAAVAGDQLLDRSVLEMALRSVASRRSASSESAEDLVEPLTEQEELVLRLIAAGLNNEEIARTLSITVNTVKTHVRHIFQKLGVSDRTQAAVWAVRHGLG